MVCRWPGRRFQVKGAALNPKSISLLGSAALLRWKADTQSLTIDLPELSEDLRQQPLWVLRLTGVETH